MNKKIILILIPVLIAILLVACTTTNIDNNKKQDSGIASLYYNGNIITMSSENPSYAEALVEQNGKIIDSVILNKDPLTVNPIDIKDIRVMETIKDGQSIFENKEDDGIVNKYWKLKILDGKEVVMTENQEREQYFKLNSSGVLSGFAGCNHFNGAYELSAGNQIRFNENLAVTMKVCTDTDIQERAFLEVFKLADNYTIKDDVLSLNVGRRAPLAVFVAVYF